ncbi:hypothetical protein P5G51_003670 [Virgibacillus sp. 179-BFC.A HS]|uniref:DUF1861 family protein n=1 Tax=Tigheibacillus jepli TaxID=3035914 RepID=A0ABU5CE58_9BACI|nr:hypothetical protein [Virgibacillus sp. 179-BFC.A HS]MDY0404625.1 hypothetical protein [Virgibacillus sp. 179-BFC.A HS]
MAIFKGIQRKLKSVMPKKQDANKLSAIPAASIRIEKKKSNLLLFIQTQAVQQMDGELLLIIAETKSTRQAYYPLVKERNGLQTVIPISELYDGIFPKHISIQCNGEQLQLLLPEKNWVEPKASFKKIIDSQKIKFTFYRRDDASLGLKAKKPKLERTITSIQDFTVAGQIGAIDGFPNCNAFLYIEEQQTLKAVKVPISGDFQVDLPTLDLVACKQKKKTFFNLFVAIMHEDGRIIRKEKIKYAHADFRKDNYYAHTTMKDDAGNVHHFLITTTPYHNMKIETFTIPHNVRIPEDPSIKDPNVWLVGERSNTAQDNGFVFYRWLQKHTDIEVYYVLEKDSRIMRK